MAYIIYKLEFSGGVRFGTSTLESVGYTFGADTFFSALCTEAAAIGEESLTRLTEYVRENKLAFSDALPYMGKEYYLPKPILPIESKNKGDSVSKKAYKKMSFVPLSELEHYLAGEMPEERTEDTQHIGKTVMKVSAAVRREEETLPYRIGVFYFAKACGLYLLVRYEDEIVREFLESLLESLSFAGIGGKRNAGLGRFLYFSQPVPEQLANRIGERFTVGMTLSVSLPKDEELDAALAGASYLLAKRSGFVASEHYASEQMRKRDLHVFQAGSCFQNVFQGDVFDVSAGGGHPVYRYAKPMFMEVSL